MADNRVSGKIEYGFREALQKLADSMKDASAIVGKWKDICTSDQPTTTLTMSTGTYEVMTLTGIKESLSDWVNKTSGTLIRTAFQAQAGSAFSYLRGSLLTFSHSKTSQHGGAKVPSYRSLGAFADVADTYRLSFVSDTDRFTSMFELPKVLEISLGTKFTSVGDTLVHKVAIRSTPNVGSLPDGRADKPVSSLATEFFIHNTLLNPVTVEFYSGADFSQKVASIVIPAHVSGRMRTALHFLCIGEVGAPVSISRVI